MSNGAATGLDPVSTARHAKPDDGFDDELDNDVGDEMGDDVTGRLIRPYAMTGGRTGAETDIGLEAQIQATTRAGDLLANYRWEAAELIQLADEPMALVELAARLEIPIGVVRVLVADLLADGALVVHRAIPANQNYSSLLERVLDGVRSL